MIRFNIIMPIYNAEKDVEKAINSVLDQDYENFLLIAVDDGSTDNSSDIIDSYKDNPHIKIIHQHNMGIAGAFKTAFAHLDGDYILFFDSDDAMRNNCLKTIAEKIQENPTDILQFGIAYHNENWEYTRQLTFEPKELNGKSEICKNYFKGLNDASDRPNLGIHAYKKEMIGDYSFPDGGTLGIDEILNLYAMTRCEKIVYIKDVFYLCQSRPNSVSRSKTTPTKNKGVLASYEVMERILAQSNEDLLDMLSVKFLKYYVSHVEYMMQMQDFSKYRLKAKKYIALINANKRVDITFKLKVAVQLFIRTPKLLKIISK